MMGLRVTCGLRGLLQEKCVLLVGDLMFFSVSFFDSGFL